MLKKGRISKELNSKKTNNVIFNTVFDACTPFLNEDTELALELTNETAPPNMSDFDFNEE